ncbi:MAG: hypothetical protein QGI83_16660 [Candidatus Latescibacteria bacterium]|jgi:hypothetical protein|nr:hypothetical protein [Candidatus Latescibacterota bacterium]
MSYVIAIAVVILAYAAIRRSRSTTPRGFARGIAQDMLVGLNMARDAYPNASQEDLYRIAVSTRRGLDAEGAKHVVGEARKLAQGMGVELKFWIVVLQLAANEYAAKVGRSPSSDMDALGDGVSSVIGDEI